MKKCALCKNAQPLALSHIFPKFIGRWMKETGAGYFRRPIEPNRRLQDLTKVELLCHECENRFSVHENYFKNKIFVPYIEHSIDEITYTESLYYFCASLLWKILYQDLHRVSPKETNFWEELEKAELELRGFLLEGHECKMPIHLFLLNVLNNDQLPAKGFNNYLLRAVDGTFGEGEGVCFLYAKFARFCMFGHLQGLDQNNWVGTKVSQYGGLLTIPQEVRDGCVGGFLVSRAQESQLLYERNATQKTMDYIERSFEKVGPEFLKTDQFEVNQIDYLTPIIEPGQFGAGRNEKCPCGSGKKFKLCCMKK